MQVCPRCFATYPPEALTCSADGAALVPEETFAHVDRDLGPGAVVGEYRIEAKLGEGGFGAVYRAVHPLIGKMAAVKVLSRQFSSNPEMVSRFIAEARAVNQIRHRNIIDIFSFGALPDGRQYYIMELLEGVSFDQYLAKKKRLPPAEAVAILRGVARALDAAHAKGILHRDLKPENVFLVSDDEGRPTPKLLDFGLVKLLADPSAKEGAAEPSSPSDSGKEHKTKTGTPMGTPYYMSPEQCRGLEVDARTDVYSFGALVFEVLTGEVPFGGTSTLDILVQHMTAAVPSASSRNPELSPRVDEVIARAMAKDARDRPRSVGETLDLLAVSVGLTPGAAADSVRSFSGLEASDERATARTEIADGAAASAPRAQTLLGSTADVAPPRRSRRVGIVLAAALAIAATAAAVVVVRRPAPNPAPAAIVVAPTPSVVASTSPAVTPAPSDAPPVAEVDLRVEGVPDGALVSADGVPLGKAPGPFKVRKDVPLKLVVTAKGYKAKELTVTPTENVLLPLALEKATAPAAGRRSPAGTPTIHSDLEGFDSKK